MDLRTVVKDEQDEADVDACLSPHVRDHGCVLCDDLELHLVNQADPRD